MPKKNISVLFIGNSFSYYHCLPKLIARFAKDARSAKVTVDGVFRGGATLKMLWEEKNTLKKIKSRRWDYIVIQERGRLGGVIKDGIVHVGNPKEFFKYVAKFHAIAKENQSKIILYCPPSFVGPKLFNDVKKLDAAYIKAGRAIHAPVIHSGIAFMTALKKQPGMKLVERDGHHPNPLGTYLIAALFYRKLISREKFKIPVVSYRSRSAKMPKNPKLMGLPPRDVQFLWSIANRAK
jgi:hypothetical protein